MPGTRRLQHGAGPGNAAPGAGAFFPGAREISTELNRDQALEMDGRAFYRARDGIDGLKDSGGLEAVIQVMSALTGILNNCLAGKPGTE
jgi:hypothetical protein